MLNDGHRVFYQERQRLSALDLEQEQTYLLELDARHNRVLHAPGIVRGLHIGSDVSGAPTVEPGVAIDALGRELLLPEAWTIPDLTEDEALDLWLVYCRDPVRVREPGRVPCASDSFQRWNESAHVVATAASTGAAPVAPADAALYLGRMPHDQELIPAFTSVRASRIKDPGGRVRVDVGPVTRRDRNAFTVVIADASGAMVTRVALDRQGANHMYGVVNLLDARGSTVVAAQGVQALLAVQAKTPGEQGQRIRVGIDPAGDAADARPSFRVLAAGPGRQVETLPLARSLGELRAAVIDFNRRSETVRLEVIPLAEGQQAETLPMGSALQSLGAGGGTLSLAGWPERQQTVTEVRGCQPPPRRRDEPGIEPNGLSFLPRPDKVPGTPLPGMYLAEIAAGERKVQQLRLDLGEKEDGDATVRLAIGVPATPSAQHWMTIDGKGLVTLVGPAVTDPNHPPTSVEVTGTIEQMPVKADILDPQFRALLVAYWLAGLQSSVQATTVVQLAFQNLPALIETEKPWAYDVVVSNQGTEDVTADTLVETRTIAGTTLLHSAANQLTVPRQGSATIAVSHQGNEMPEGDLTIEVRISGKIRTFPWWKSLSTSQPIPVVETPLVDMTGLPDTAPAGADFDYSFDVTNRAAGRALTVNAVAVREGNTTQQLMAAPQTLDPGESASFGPLTHPGGITADLQAQITADYQWANGPAKQVIASKRIEVEQDVDVQFPPPLPSIVRNQAYTYDLKLKNVGASAVLIESLRHRIRRGHGQPGPATDIAAAANVAILPGQTVTLPAVTGIVITQTGLHRIQVQPTYRRGSTSWTPRYESSPEIDVTT